MHLNPYAVLDVQDHTANEFLWAGYGSNGKLAAKNDNVNYFSSLLQVDNNPLPLTMPCATCVSPASGWFVPVSGTEYDCLNPDPDIGYNCNPQLRSINCEEGISELERQIATHYIQFSEGYSEEAFWIAVRQLYEKLYNCRELRNSEQLLIDFYTQYTNTVVSQLTYVKGETGSLHEITLNEETALNDYRLQLESLNHQLADYQNQYSHATNSELKRQLLYLIQLCRNQIEEVNQLIALIYDAIRTRVSLTVSDLINYNTSLLPTQQYAINEQIINDVVFNRLSSGSNLFTAQQISDIYSVASQCPYSGGPSVFRARGLYMMINNRLSFNDRDICLQGGIAWRKSSESQGSLISVSPNPARNEVEFTYTLPKYKTAVLQIRNSYNSLVRNVQINESSSRLTVSTDDLNNGIYYYSIVAGDQKIGSGKLAVIH